MTKESNQSGFTVVELLVTLFVAAIFLASGYQLYILMTKDSGETRDRSKANNVAYDYLQQYKAKATNPCTTTPSLATTSIPINGLSNTTIAVDVTCPYSSAAVPITSVSKITVTIKYGTPQKTVINATYITK